MDQLRIMFNRILSYSGTKRADAALRDWVDTESTTMSRRKFAVPRRTKLKLNEVSWIVAQLATTQAAGIPLFRALGMIAKMRAGTVIGTKCAALQDATSEGATLSGAMATHMPEAGTLISALVSAGEASGSLEESLRRALELTEGRQRLRRKLRSAMTYPAMVVIVCGALVTAVLTVVVPKFKEIYASVGSELPAITQLVIGMADRLPIVGALLALLVGVIIYIVRRSKTDEKLGASVDLLKLRVPVLGGIMQKAAIARIAQTLASLVSSGVSLLDALTLAARTAGTVPHTQALLFARERIGEGSTLAAALAETKLFPELMVQLVAVGEESGSLAQVLERYAKEAAEELDSSADAITSLIEPMLMVFIGVVIAGFVVALYLPVINLGKTLGG